MGIVMAYLLSFLTTSLLYFPRMKSAVFGSYSLPLLKELMRFGGPLLLGNLSILILSISDRWFLMALSTETELGLYSFGYKFADLLATFMTYAFQLAWTPIAWKSFQSEEGKRFFHEVEKFIMTFFPIIIFLALPVLFSLAQFMTGNHEYRQGLQITLIIALSHVFYAYYIFNSIKTLHYDKKKNLILGNVLAAALNTLLNIALIKDYGMFGAAWATLISYVFMYVWIECVSIPELAIYRKDRWKLLLLNVLAIGIVTYITSTISEQVDIPILYLRSWLAAVLIFALALALKVISPRYFSLLKSIYSEFRSGKKGA
jgi:O-antigen/teichoic acid export membrane protein